MEFIIITALLAFMFGVLAGLEGSEIDAPPVVGVIKKVNGVYVIQFDYSEKDILTLDKFTVRVISEDYV